MIEQGYGALTPDEVDEGSSQVRRSISAHQYILSAHQWLLSGHTMVIIGHSKVDTHEMIRQDDQTDHT